MGIHSVDVRELGGSILCRRVDRDRECLIRGGELATRVALRLQLLCFGIGEG
jgi:hypothetical protein